MSQFQTEGGGNGSDHIDTANMDVSAGSSNAPPDMSAMRTMQGRSVVLSLNHGSVMQRNSAPPFVPKSGA